MNSAKHIDQEEFALFAMQLLSLSETAADLSHLEHCEECRRELATVQGDLALYAHTVDLHSPPAQARERLLKQVGREKKIVPITRSPVVEARVLETRPTEGRGFEDQSADRRPLDIRPLETRPIEGRPADTRPPDTPFRAGATLGIESSYLRAAYSDEDEQPHRGFATRALPWVGWAVAAGLAFTAGDLYQQRNSLQKTVAASSTQLARLTEDAAAARQLFDTLNDPAAMRVTLQKPSSAPVPQARATYSAVKGSLLFTASNLEPLPPYKVYELWLIPTDSHDPIPAGTFHPDARGNASVILPTLPKGVAAKAFGVTIEDEGGATTPTLPIILAGA